MINIRDIFNPSNNYIGLILIFLIALLIIIIKKDLKSSIYQISKISFISGTITLIITLLSSLIIDNFILTNYKIFIEIISKNVINSIYLYSMIILVISGVINLTIKFGFKES